MTKVTLPDITSGYNLSAINSNFQKIEDELNNKVLYRQTQDGEPNAMFENLDMNSNDVLNAGEISTGRLFISGQEAVPTELVNEAALTALNLYKADMQSSAGASLTGYKRPTANSVLMTVGRKLQTVRHCSDWGILCDGSDETSKLMAMVSDINSIPNPSGFQVHVVFGGQSDSYAPVLKFLNTVQFTRPVHLDGLRETYISYLGSGNAFEFGPSNLTGNFLSSTDVNVHKYYSVEGFGASGGTTSKACFYFHPWVLYPSVDFCRFEAFGGNGSWSVYCQYNNWSVYVRNCEFWGKTNSVSDNANKRNFVGCPGALTNGTRDEFATRLNAIDNWIYSGGYTTGGTAYLISGWKSRVQGGGIEGPTTGIIIGAGCNDVEISGVYWESLFSDAVTPPRFMQLSYTGDPYYPTYQTVQRLRINDAYLNMHNTDALASNGRVLICNSPLKVQKLSIDGMTLVHSGQPALELPDIDGHSVDKIDGVVLDGNVSANTYLLITQYPGVRKPSLISKKKNYNSFQDFSAIVTGASGPFPINSSLGASGILVVADGTGGALQATKGSTNNTSGTGYERHRLFQQLEYGYFEKTVVPTGNTFFTVTLDTSAKLMDMQGLPAVLSFVAKAVDNPCAIYANHVFSDISQRTQSLNTATVSTSDWLHYALRFDIPTLAGGVSSNGTQKIELVLPSGSTLFKLGIAGVVLTVGDVAYPLNWCN